METGFNWLDYTILAGYVFAILAIASIFVKEQHNLTDFFLASKKMPWLAVGCSIIATVLSAISITGIPAEYWQNGLRITTSIITPILAAPIVILLFVRIYRHLNVITAYEYLEKRFSLAVRLIASVLFMLFRGSYLGVVIVSSATILKPAFGGRVDLLWLIIGVGVFSAAFAILGGMKAVIWTDVVQLVVVYGGIAWMLVSILARMDNGLAGVWQTAVENGKDFSFLADPKYFSIDLFERTTFFGIVFGYFFMELATQGTDQMTVQRYLTTKSVRASAKSIFSYIFMTIPIMSLLWLIGMCLFAFYQNHPLPQFVADKPNFLLPYYIVTQLPHGISGLFIAAIIAAILSTVDSGMNCLATASMNDFHLRLFKTNYTGAQHVFWARLWTAIWGIITTGLAVLIYLTERENIVRTCLNVIGLYAGPLLAIFLVGLLVKRANSRGILIGAVLGLALVIWINYFYVMVDPVTGKEIHISFIWPASIGAISTFVLGTIASLFFKKPSLEKVAGLTYWDFRNSTG
ncbi:MAG: sodium:solute symporter family transporter [Planctomycetota bacterium]|jgi:SSS family transporter